MSLNQQQLQGSTSSFIERREIKLEPGHTMPVNIYGRVFYCNMATGPFEMNFNDGEFFPILGRGVEWALVGDDRYSRLAFRAKQTTTLEFYAGNFAYHENVVVPVSKVAQTLLRPVPIVTSTFIVPILGFPLDVPTPLYSLPLGPGASIDLPGLGEEGSGLGYRKHLIVTNLDPDADLDLLDKYGNPRATVFARQANVFETSDDLQLKNNNAAPVAYRIMDIFYAA